jgi:hypothetical protein
MKKDILNAGFNAGQSNTESLNDKPVIHGASKQKEKKEEKNGRRKKPVHGNLGIFANDEPIGSSMYPAPPMNTNQPPSNEFDFEGMMLW